MKKIIKRKLALLLTIVIAFSTMVLSVSASETTTEESENLYGYISESYVTPYINSAETTTMRIRGDELLPMTTWNYFDTQTFQASVGGLAISVGVGLLGLAATPAAQVVSYFLGVFASGVFGTGYTLTEVIDRYTGNINASLGTYDMKNECKVYGGPSSNIYQRLAYSWTTIQTRYS